MTRGLDLGSYRPQVSVSKLFGRAPVRWALTLPHGHRVAAVTPRSTAVFKAGSGVGGADASDVCPIYQQSKAVPEAPGRYRFRLGQNRFTQAPGETSIYFSDCLRPTRWAIRPISTHQEWRICGSAVPRAGDTAMVKTSVGLDVIE